MEKNAFHLPSHFQTENKTYLHMITLRALYVSLDTDPIKGLSSDKAKRRLEINGPNTIDKPDFETLQSRIWRNIFRGFMGPIWLAAFFTILVYLLEFFIHGVGDNNRLIIGFALLLAIFLSTLIRHWQAFNDEAIWKAFKSLQARYCTVWRDGQKQVIDARNIVMGDIVDLTSGDRVAADMRIIKSNGLIVDNVALKGAMTTMALDPNVTDYNALKAPNVVFASSFVVSGSGKAVVIASGRKRLLSRLALISGSKKSTLLIDYHAISLTYFNYSICVSVFVILIFALIFTSITWIKIFVLLTGFIVACVPTGLVISTHFGLSCARQSLLGNNCLVQNLEAIEVIGSTSVICSELQGTFTMHRLTVTDVYTDDKLLHAKQIGLQQYMESDCLKALCLCATLCNNAYVNAGTLGVPELKKDVSGNAVDKAIFTFMRIFMKNINELRVKYEKIADKPHTTYDKHQVSVHHFSNQQGEMRRLVLMKGDLETVLTYCESYLIEGETRELDEAVRKNISEIGHTLWAAGKYVIGFCDLEMDATPSEELVINSDVFQSSIKSMRFLGIIALYDPPRSTVRYAVDLCRNAGIKIVIMTHMSVNFARSIAETAGLVAGKDESIDDVAERLGLPVDDLHPNLISSVVVDSRTLRDDNEATFIECILSKHADVVFAKVMEDQRVLIVDICRRLGAIVVSNGSSILNSPSLRKADIGIAKGITCSRIVKCCADFILLDDSFMTIVIAIEEGRLLFKNIKKAIAYILSSNMGQILCYFGFLILHLPMPICVHVGLIIDVIVDMLPSLTLFYEKAEENLMNDKPCTDLIINRQMIFLVFMQIGLIEAAAAFLAYFIIMARNGFFPWDLIGVRTEWDDASFNDLTDSYGQEWTYDDRRKVSHRAGSGFLMGIATLQVVNLIVTRTIRANLIEHGFGNHRLNIACILMPTIIILICNINRPDIFHLTPLPDNWWVYILPFGVLLFIFETVRRFFLRAFPGGWIESETYY